MLMFYKLVKYTDAGIIGVYTYIRNIWLR